MKIKIFDSGLAAGGNSIGSMTLQEEINQWQEQHNVSIKDIEISTYTHDGHLIAAVIYDEPRQILQKSFELSNDLEINDFTKTHDVIKVEHFGDFDEIDTIITYRESKEK